MKSGRLNPLEPSGPVQACTGIFLIAFLLIYLTTPHHKHGLCNVQNGIIVSGESEELKINHSGLFEFMPSISELCYNKSEIQEEIQ
jgi:hypothetical protein